MANKNFTTSEVFIYPDKLSFDAQGNLNVYYEREVRVDGLADDEYLEKLDITEEEANNRDDVLTEIVTFQVKLGPNEQQVGSFTDKIFYHIRKTETEQPHTCNDVITQRIAPQNIIGPLKGRTIIECNNKKYKWNTVLNIWIQDTSSTPDPEYDGCYIRDNQINPIDLPGDQKNQQIITCEGITYEWDEDSSTWQRVLGGPGDPNDGPDDCTVLADGIPPSELPDNRTEILCDGVYWIYINGQWIKRDEVQGEGDDEVTPCIAIQYNLSPELIPELGNPTRLTCDGIVHEWNGSQWNPVQVNGDCDALANNLPPSQIGGKEVISCNGTDYYWTPIPAPGRWEELTTGGGTPIQNDSSNGTLPGVASLNPTNGRTINVGIKPSKSSGTRGGR